MECVFSGIGRVAGDLRLNSEKEEKPYVRFQLCVTYKDKEEASFLPMYAEKGVAHALVKRANKGDLLYVIAEPFTRRLSFYNTYTEFRVREWRVLKRNNKDQ